MPNMLYTIEVFGNASPASTEAEFYLGDTTVVTDSDGKARFSVVIDAKSGNGKILRSFTSTATSAGGATSPIGSPLVMKNNRGSS